MTVFRAFLQHTRIIPGLVTGLPWPEDLLDGVHERMVTLAAGVPEVVQVQGPDHATSKVHLTDILGLKSTVDTFLNGAKVVLSIYS